jgi:hypothetical protein
MNYLLFEAYGVRRSSQQRPWTANCAPTRLSKQYKSRVSVQSQDVRTKNDIAVVSWNDVRSDHGSSVAHVRSKIQEVRIYAAMCLLSTAILQTLQLTFERPTQMRGSKQTLLVICNISLFSGVRLQAFASPDALGVIAVSDVPYLKERRGRLLPLAARLAHLDEDILERYTRPKCNYSVGWSRGQECMKPGQRDSLKGSFYANPLRDYCTDDDAMQTHSSADPMTYCNIIFLGCYIKMTCSCRQSRSS